MADEQLNRLFPVTTDIDEQGQLRIAGHRLSDLADQYQTPLYVYDGETVRAQVRRLTDQFAHHYPGETMIAYASKAYFSYSMATKMAALGIGADVVSLGEIHVAQQAGFAPEGIHLHGNNKTEAELQAALEWGVQSIVVDSLEELDLLEALAERTGLTGRIWARITPDLNVNTHPHIETSHSDSKFGMHVKNGDALTGIRRAMASKRLTLTGLHTHLGSQIFEAYPYEIAIERLYAVAEEAGYIPQEISPGGGWGVPYTESDPDDDPEPWVRAVSGAVQAACRRLGWPLPKLVLEPGRWLVARAGVALYRVGMQKTTPDGTHIVAIDGGLADNPRVALYGASYTARVAQRASALPIRPVRVVGKFCESGDVLIPGVNLPAVQRGDVLAVPASGAYQLSMSSNYNFAARPPVVWLERGAVEVMQCCEQPDEPGWWVYSRR
jgi:diaminopimelate decarboxylase